MSDTHAPIAANLCPEQNPRGEEAQPLGSPHSFASHREHFVTLCERIIRPGMEEGRQRLEAEGWQCDLHSSEGETTPASGNVEPHLFLTLTPPGGLEEAVMGFVSFYGNYPEPDVQVCCGQARGRDAPRYVKASEITPAFVRARISQAAASAAP
jgi:hypothetical protein